MLEMRKCFILISRDTWKELFPDSSEWRMDRQYEAYFHKWGIDTYRDDYGKTFEYTVGIVELNGISEEEVVIGTEGQVVVVYPECIVFADVD